MNHLTVRDLALAGTTPSRQVLGMVEDLAATALDHADPANLSNDPAVEALAAAAFRLLVKAGYRPPSDFPDRWTNLITLLDRRGRAQEMGPSFDDHDDGALDDFDADIHNELVGLAGRPL